MNEAVKLAGHASGSDPARGLRAVFALRRLLDRLEAAQVANARSKGWTWPEIADALQVTKQAVHQKHASHIARPGKES